MATRTGDYYFTTFINTYSHHVVVRLMKPKGEIVKFAQEYLDCTETIMGKHATHFHMADTGNGTFDTLQAYLNTKGISCKAVNKHTPGIESTAAQTASRLVKSGSTPVGGPVKSTQRQAREEDRGLDKRLVQPELVTDWIQ